MQRTIGILALQGDFAKHSEMFQKLSVATLPVKKPEDLKKCDGLVIPGGESTTLTKLMQAGGFYEPVRDFAKHYPVMGTCAGAILAAHAVDDIRISPLRLIDIDVQRNAYGRQIDSFIAELSTTSFNGNVPFKGMFIRAPKIQRVGQGVRTLIELQGQPVMVQENHILVLTFHPELTDDARIHKYFLML
jgi:pyridoxal 5'-phosphate synthase pdxT subunit